MDNKWQENQFYGDTMRQLKAGLPCYVYKQEQVEELKKIYKDKTGFDLKVEQEDYYYILRPKKKITTLNY